MLRIAERFFPWLAAMIALTFGWMGVEEVFETGNRPHRLSSVLFALAVSVLFGVAAASVWFRWRILRSTAFLCGGCAALFTLSVLVKGWDDASGVLGPLFLAISGATTALGLILSMNRVETTTPPDNSLERTHGE
jgi:hypothetical protein